MSGGQGRRRTRSGGKFRQVVLAILFLASLQYLPSIDAVLVQAPKDGEPSKGCSCSCGTNCQCTGGCCSDSHVVNAEPSSSTDDREAMLASSTTEMKRQSACLGGLFVATAFSTFQPFVEPRGRTMAERRARQFLQPGTTVYRWSRPAVSRSNPRAPPVSLAT